MVSSVGNVENRIDLIRNRIAKACQDAGRLPSSVDLVAVSKKTSAESIRAAYACGQRRFGESYADELLEKAQQLSDLDICWVFIGPLQTNKIAKIMKCAHEIQSVGSEKHVRFIDQFLQKNGIDSFPIFIQVNAGNEQQKFGLDSQKVIELSKLVQIKYPRLHVEGIMAIPPEDVSKQAMQGSVPEMFCNLKECARHVGAGKLSLGMSQDLEAAVRVGSNCVRIGTAIFENSMT